MYSSSRQQALHSSDPPARPPSRRGFRIIKQTEALLSPSHSNNEVPRRSNAPSPEAAPHISIAGFDGLVDCYLRCYDIRESDIRPKMRQS
jgi:hypothetical protein